MGNGQRKKKGHVIFSVQLSTKPIPVTSLFHGKIISWKLFFWLVLKLTKHFIGGTKYTWQLLRSIFLPCFYFQKKTAWIYLLVKKTTQIHLVWNIYSDLSNCEWWESILKHVFIITILKPVLYKCMYNGSEIGYLRIL